MRVRQCEGDGEGQGQGQGEGQGEVQGQGHMQARWHEGEDNIPEGWCEVVDGCEGQCKTVM